MLRQLLTEVNSEMPRQRRCRAGGSDYQISFALKPAGAEKFGAWTGANINQYMGVVLNDEVKSIAFIKSQIFDQGQIGGRFTKRVCRRSGADAEIRGIAGAN